MRGKLSERQLKLRQEMSAVLNDKISILNPHFSEISVRQTTEWSLPPADPAKAFRLLRETSEKDLIVNYFAVVAENSKADIPWWSALFRSGVEVLEKAASHKSPKRFPTARNRRCGRSRCPTARREKNSTPPFSPSSLPPRCATAMRNFPSTGTPPPPPLRARRLTFPRKRRSPAGTPTPRILSCVSTSSPTRPRPRRSSAFRGLGRRCVST